MIVGVKQGVCVITVALIPEGNHMRMRLCVYKLVQQPAAFARLIDGSERVAIAPTDSSDGQKTLRISICRCASEKKEELADRPNETKREPA